MKRTISFFGRPIPYELTRKSVKNLNARVRRDGSLLVSVPPCCSDREIEEFLLSHMPRLVRAMDAAASQQALAPPALSEGAVISILGEPITLHLVRGSRRGVREAENALQLTLYPHEEEGRYATLLSAYLNDRACRLLDGICQEIYARYFDGCFPYPAVHYRCMVSRWGSCHKSRGVIVLNKRLLYAPMPAVEYVVLHELTHLLHPDHGAGFYAAIARRMPDYRSRAAMLRQVDLRRTAWL